MDEIIDKIFNYNGDELNVVFLSDTVEDTILMLVTKLRVKVNLKCLSYIRLDTYLENNIVLFKFSDPLGLVKCVNVSIWDVNQKIYRCKYNKKRPTLGVVSISKDMSKEYLNDSIKGIDYCLHPTNRELIYV
jgi:hypothetical protein